MYFSEHVLDDSVFTTLTHCIYGIKTHTVQKSDRLIIVALC